MSKAHLEKSENVAFISLNFGQTVTQQKEYGLQKSECQPDCYSTIMATYFMSKAYLGKSVECSLQKSECLPDCYSTIRLTLMSETHPGKSVECSLQKSVCQPDCYSMRSEADNCCR